MSNPGGLRFLRPYLCGLPASDKAAAAYARVFTASCTNRYYKTRPLSCRISQHRRGLHGKKGETHSSDASKDDHGIATPSSRKARSTKVSEDELATPSSRAITVEKRVQKLQAYDALKYPRVVRPDPGGHLSIADFRRLYEKAELEKVVLGDVALAGRIMSIRRSGSKLMFLHILGGYQKVQIMVNLSNLRHPELDIEAFKKALHSLRRGDIISVVGTATRTKAGELTLKALELPIILTPALAPLPEELTNEETKILNRHVDMLVNRKTSDTLRLRSQILKCMREFFHELDFLEVQTPILAASAGGALARPFTTSATGLPEKELSMRIAPELWLKRLVVGGHDRVFEIGPSFRNEGLDPTHNPEFTTCEFYCAYSGLDNLILVTELLITRLLREVDKMIDAQLTSIKKPEISIPDKNWKQVEFIPALEKALGFQFPDLSQPDAHKVLVNYLPQSINVPEDITLNKLLDQLAATYLEPASANEPLFITHHPACMSPLAKSFECPKTGQLVSARAELFIQGREIANMYEEENDPFEQRRKFELQMQAKGDEGPAHIDENYVQALEHGLPPTGGWGCGVDRLVMFLSGAERISDTLPFGNLKNVVSLTQKPK